MTPPKPGQSGDLFSQVRPRPLGVGELTRLLRAQVEPRFKDLWVAGEVASTHPVLREATADVFESWLGAIAHDAQQAGVEPGRSRSLALSILALLEGAFLLSRAQRDTEPMDAAGVAALELLRAALPHEPHTKRRTS